jgi:hypothetical protein
MDSAQGLLRVGWHGAVRAGADRNRAVQLVEHVPGEHLVLEAFDDYWGGLPPAARVTFQGHSRGVDAALRRSSAAKSTSSRTSRPIRFRLSRVRAGSNISDVPLANVHVLRYNTQLSAARRSAASAGDEPGDRSGVAGRDALERLGLRAARPPVPGVRRDVQPRPADARL